MCLAVPMKVVEIQGEKAFAEVNGIRREIGLQLLGDVQINDWVIIHAGFAIAKLNEKEAQKTLDLFREGGYIS